MNSQSVTGAAAWPVAALLLVIFQAPGGAEGGVACEFGPADYRRCCNDSYRQKPDLGVRARAEDIDVCMKSSKREGRDRDAGDNSKPPVPAEAGKSPIRRIGCAAGECEKGCDADEMAISAFCNVGMFPTLSADGNARCATNSGSEPPLFLVCAKK